MKMPFLRRVDIAVKTRFFVSRFFKESPFSFATDLSYKPKTVVYYLFDTVDSYYLKHG